MQSAGNDRNNAATPGGGGGGASGGPAFRLSIEHAYGSSAPKIDPLLSFSALSGNKDFSDRLLYKIGRRLCVYDPETQSQEFFNVRPKNVVDILHYTISPNGRYISMCESIRHEKATNDAASQVSVYLMSTYNHLNTCHYALPRPFVCSTFCGDRDCKQIAALSDEPDRMIVIWYWDKEKVHKTIQVSVNATLLRCAPIPQLMLTTTGAAALKTWCIAPDGSLKMGNMLPPAKELLDNYTDHIWLGTSAHGAVAQYRMIILVDPDPNNEINRTRRQSLYIMEGREVAIGGSSSSSTAANVPLAMELKQTIQLKLDVGARAEKIVPSGKGFLLVGDGGLILMYDRTDDKNEPFMETKRLTLGKLHLVGATVYPAEDKMVILTRTNRLLSMQMDIQADQLSRTMAVHTDHDKHGSPQHHTKGIVKGHSTGTGGSHNASAGSGGALALNMAGINDLTKGGYHNSTILSADMAYDRPLLLTLGGDMMARLWNYHSGKCEIVHHFLPTEEPLACAMHPNGFQCLISFKDRVRLYNILLDKLRVAKETVLKNCKCLKFSHGAQYWAAASGINVNVYDTRTFAQLVSYPGHMMPVSRVAWAPGDQILFSAGSDGNVYGWPISSNAGHDNTHSPGSGSGGNNGGGRIEVITANNRSSAIMDVFVDSLSTVFPAEKAGPNPLLSGDGGDAGANNNNAVVDAASAMNNPEGVLFTGTQRSWLLVTSRDGHMRLPQWSLTPYNVKEGGGTLTNQGAGSEFGSLPQGQASNLSSNNKSSAAISLKDGAGNKDGDNGANGSALTVASSIPSSLRTFPTMDGIATMYGESHVAITALCLSTDRTKLFVGTLLGSLRVYTWPPEPQHLPLVPLTAAGSTVSTAVSGTRSEAAAHHNKDALALSNAAEKYHHPQLCYEVYSHSGPVVSIGLGTRPNIVVSCAADGSVFIHHLHDERPLNQRQAGNAGAKIFDPFADEDEVQNKKLNDDVVMLATEDVEEHVNQVIELQKALAETRAQNEFNARKMDVEHAENLKKISENHEVSLQKERDAFERQRNNYENRLRELMQSIESKDADHAKVVTQMENQYEHRLADQIMRYDLLSEKMQLLKQKCEALVESEREKFHGQLTSLKTEHASTIKKLQHENRRALEDKSANENAYREIITQQEEEYEDELKALIGAAESELVSERDLILRLRTAMSDKQTQYDHLKKKFEELQRASRARMELLERESRDKKKLQDTIEHYQKNLAEREEALAEKEKIVLELRSKTRTLENFRFVLDHRLQQLSSERGPITSHIEGLEKHIATMYEEWVDEFAAKKVAAEANQLKDQKITWLSQDLNKWRATCREKEQYIAGFKREIGNIVASMIVGKELEESVHAIYRKFVKGEGDSGDANNNNNSNNKTSNNKTIPRATSSQGKGSNTGGSNPNNRTGVRMSAKVGEVVHELLGPNFGGINSAGVGMLNATSNGGENSNNNDDASYLSLDTMHGGRAGQAASKTLLKEVEDALVETAKEADRQKNFVERQSRNLRHRLRSTEKEAHVISRHRLHENSDLLFECNDLRAENKELQRKIGLLRHDLETTQRQLLFSRSNNNNTTTNAHDQTTGGSPNRARPSSAGIAASSKKAAAVAAGENQQLSSTAPALSVSASAPALSTKKAASRKDGGSLGPSHVTASTPQLQPVQGTTVSFALPSPTLVAGDKSIGGGLMAQKQVEKLNHTVVDLATQLDEALRERETQRLEVTRLRKQLQQLQLAAGGVSGGGSLTSLNAPSQTSGTSGKGDPNNNSNNNNNGHGNVHLPSINSGGGGGTLHLGLNSSSGLQQPSLTQADLTGTPSEEDRLQHLRLVPASYGTVGAPNQQRNSGNKKSGTTTSKSRGGSKDSGSVNGGLGNDLLRNLSLNSQELERDEPVVTRTASGSSARGGRSGGSRIMMSD